MAVFLLFLIASHLSNSKFVTAVANEGCYYLDTDPLAQVTRCPLAPTRYY